MNRMLVICKESDFVKYARQSNGIIVVGISVRIVSILENLERKFSGKLKYVVDNNVDKQGSNVEINGRCHRVYSFSAIENNDLDNFIILVCNKKYHEILDQLETLEKFESLPCFCYQHILALENDDISLQRKIPSNLKLLDEQVIPKIIHYCWFGGNPIPEKYKVWMESWKKYCPDYTIKRWDETNYDIQKCRYMVEAYERKKWGFVSDFARLDVVHEYGGIYLDTDVELIRGLDDLLYQKGFMGYESTNFVSTGLGFGAVKGHPILKETLDEYYKRRFVNDDGSENQICCPQYQTELLKKHGLAQNGEYQVVADMTIYPEKVLCGKNMYTMMESVNEYTRAIHHYDGSWSEEIWKKRNDRLRNAVHNLE